ncbi:MAG: O-antigen ligase family protein [Acidobacteriota bacterium]|nr:MAG: O-antigen ligase family protein [Acidobacteriota bacterium]
MLTPIPYGAVEMWSIALWEVFIFGLMLLWGLKTLVDGRIEITLSPLLLPLVGLLIVATIQIMPIESGDRATISYDPYVTMQTGIKILASICFFLLFTSFVNTDERRNIAVRVIIGVCVLIALVGIGQSYIGKALWQRGTFGPFVNRNHFAGFLEMGVGLAGGLIVGRSVRRELIAVYASCILAMVAGIVLSASRGGVLALAAEILFLAIIAVPLFLSRKRGEARFGMLLRAGGALVLGAAAIIGSMYLVGSEGLVQNISQTSSELEEQQPASERFSRTNIWSATARMIEDHPWLGVGMGAYQFAYTRYDPSSGAQRVEQSHNDYLQIVADAGIAGGVIALVFIIMFFARSLSAAQTRDRRRRSIILGALAGCFAIAVHSFVEFNLQVTSNSQLFLALVVLATEKSNHDG